MIRLISIILISFSQLYSQNFPTPEEVLGKQEKPKKKISKLPKGDWVAVTTDFETKSKRVEYMKKNMAMYCLNEPVYGSAVYSIFYGTELALVDTGNANGGIIITIKMSDNSTFVFMFHNLCNFRGENSGYANVTYFNYKHGEVDPNSIKTFVSKKKRLFPNNNKYTEELTIGQMKFTIEEKTNATKMLFAGKEIALDPYDHSKGYLEGIGK